MNITNALQLSERASLWIFDRILEAYSYSCHYIKRLRDLLNYLEDERLIKLEQCDYNYDYADLTTELFDFYSLNSYLKNNPSPAYEHFYHWLEAHRV